MSRFAFWSSIAFIVYAYLLFPVLLAIRAVAGPQSYRQAAIVPSLSLIVAAHNEAGVIAAKLANVLSLDYPPDRLEIIVASDGSDDGTDEVVGRFASQGVRLLSLPRLGKAAALNAAAAVAGGEVLVFSDANSIYTRDALLELVRPLADPQVGGVAGNQRYLGDGSQEGPSGEAAYWRLDRQWKRLESAAGSAVSATGAIYAVRRSLFRPVAEGVTDDFYTSTGVIDQGYRLVFAPEAIAFETLSKREADQYGRKVRIITRGLRGVLLRRNLLNPFRHGFYAVQLFTHKVMRRLVVFPLLTLLVSSLRLRRRSRFYRLVAAAQLAFYGSAAAGALLERSGRRQPRLLSLAYYFGMVNVAAIAAVLNLLRRRQIVIWQPQQREAEA
jgi:cellulose synthase/poly-beta-1,6-N-acetylglucosamine synthase-like glycosyltransferase